MDSHLRGNDVAFALNPLYLVGVGSKRCHALNFDSLWTNYPIINMAKRIALFCHKGGVSKTTTTFNLGWMLADRGHKVLIVDADSQCNLTALVMGEDKFEDFYKTGNLHNIKDALTPAFKSKAMLVEAVECFTPSNSNLFLLPGHLGLSEYETTLSFAQTSPEAIFTLQNIPGAFSFLFAETAKKYEIDYILIDMSPSLGSINQNLLMTSDYFIIPTSPDYFSIMAIDSMSMVLPKWAIWADKFMSMDILTQEALYPLPIVKPRLLGAVVQRFSRRYGEATQQFQHFIDGINDRISGKLFPELVKKGMCFPQEHYDEILGKNNIFLAKLPDFASLTPLSQKYNKAIFALEDCDIGQSGVVLDNLQKKQKNIKQTFSQFADYIQQLTTE